MKLVLNSEQCLEQQEILIGEIISNIADELERVGLSGESLKGATGAIAFKIAAMLDGASEVSFDGCEALPYICFINKVQQDQLMHLGGNTYMHELVYGILEAMFGNAT